MARSNTSGTASGARSSSARRSSRRACQCRRRTRHLLLPCTRRSKSRSIGRSTGGRGHGCRASSSTWIPVRACRTARCARSGEPRSRPVSRSWTWPGRRAWPTLTPPLGAASPASTSSTRTATATSPTGTPGSSRCGSGATTPGCRRPVTGRSTGAASSTPDGGRR